MRTPLPPLAAPIFFFVGLLAIVWAVLAFRSQQRFLGSALRAKGVIQSLNVERMKGSTVYFPVIRFTTAAGATIVAASKSGRSGGYSTGQTVSVLYDPNQPDHLEMDAFWSRWLFVIVAAFLALLAFGIGATALLTPVG